MDQIYATIAADVNPRPKYRFVHFSDWHIDYNYTVGALKQDCREENCC